MTLSDDQRRQRAAIGRRLTDARIAAGYPNRKEACENFGFNLNSYKDHEYGKRGVTQAEAEQYGAAFGISAYDLLTSREVIESTEPSISAPHNDEIRTTEQNPHQNRTNLHQNTHHGADFDLRGAKIPKKRTTDGAVLATGTIPVIGAAAYGVWLSSGSTPLQRDIAVPPVPTHPVDLQYARQAVEDSRTGLYRNGDYLIFVRHDGTHPRTGHYDIRRQKGVLGEHSVWMAQGRIMTADGGDADNPEEFHLDPDDTSVTILGRVVAVYRPVIS